MASFHPLTAPRLPAQPGEEPASPTISPDSASPHRARILLEAARRLFHSITNSTPPGAASEAFEAAGIAVPISSNAGELACEPATSEEDCPICLVTLNDCVKTPCGHLFHRGCLEHYFMVAREPGTRAKCPLCRSAVHAPLPIEAEAASGLPIEVVSVPSPGGRCHFDRRYIFTDLGSFSQAGSALPRACRHA